MNSNSNVVIDLHLWFFELKKNKSTKLEIASTYARLNDALSISAAGAPVQARCGLKQK